MDALTEALNAVRIRSTVHCPIEVSGDWGMSAESKEGAKFFIVLQGSCWIAVEAEEPLRLETGDFVVVTRPLSTTIRTTPDTPVTSLATFLATNQKGLDGMFRCGTGDAKSLFIGGCFYFEDFQTSPLLRALPVLLHVSGEQGKAFGLDTTIRAVLAEALSGRPGVEIVLTRLSDILFIQALRAYLTQLPDREANWLRAALDPQIGKALTAIHQNPAHSWQVGTLAAESAMSRSAFAARFAELIGESPLRYITRWRIHKASHLLCEQNFSVAQVAAESGYQSEAAFSKVFKQWTGRTPTAFRRDTE